MTNVRLALVLVKERDCILTILSLLVFGVWSWIDPTPSMAVLPQLAQYGTYVVIILASLLLGFGEVYRRQTDVFIVGHIFGIVGLLTVAGVVVTTSESPVSVLIFGFATSLSYSLQKALRERAIVRAVLNGDDE